MSQTFEPHSSHLSGQVNQAENALLSTLDQEPARQWSPRELQEEATNGWSASVVSIAFWRLVSSGRLSVDEQLRVRPRADTAS
jgi:hypothetical protein